MLLVSTQAGLIVTHTGLGRAGAGHGITLIFGVLFAGLLLGVKVGVGSLVHAR